MRRFEVGKCNVGYRMTGRLLVVVKLPVAYGGCPTVGGCRHPGLLANMQPAQARASLVWRSCRLAFQNCSFGTAGQAVSAPETVLVAGSHGWLCNVLPASRLRAHGAVRAINIKMLTAVSCLRQWQALPRVMLVGGVRYSAACVFTFFELHNKTWMNAFFSISYGCQPEAGSLAAVMGLWAWQQRP